MGQETYSDQTDTLDRMGLPRPAHDILSTLRRMSKTKSVEPSERPLAKTVLAKLIQIGEPTRSIYAERLRELKSNAREARELLSGWEGKRAELALTQPLSHSIHQKACAFLGHETSIRGMTAF